MQMRPLEPMASREGTATVRTMLETVTTGLRRSIICSTKKSLAKIVAPGNAPLLSCAQR